MDNKINNLISKILTIQQYDYRVGDIIFKKAALWEYSGNQVLNNQKYDGSILKSYLQIKGLYSQTNLKILLDIIKEYSEKNNLYIPSDNELVLHLRLGDFVDYRGILTKPYIKLIREYINKNPNINKITIVTAFSYGTLTKESLHLKTNKMPMWNCTQETQNTNKNKMRNFIKRIYNNFPNIELDIISSSNIDNDFCYCVNSKYFINDIGGFSDLLMKLNKLRKNKLQNQQE